MKKVFLTLAVLVMAICASAQKNQYFWYQGNLMMGNPIAQIDSVTFGEGEPADTLHIMLPRTIIKTVHDTVYITIHDTVCPNAEHNGFRYVDLGLSVMWADANVGAEKPEDYGNYYCWGEVEPRDYYGFYDYNYGQYSTMSKYCPNSSLSFHDNLTRLLPEDDAASVNMGGSWRTPTRDEWQELIDNCNMILDTINSRPSIKFIASNGNSIFIPRAGSMWGSSYDDWEETFGSGISTLNRGVQYWSSDVKQTENCGDAWAYTNRWNGGIILSLEYHCRQEGASVRGVFTK